MVRVKDMPRSQQKAVFARMTDDSYLKTLEGAEKFRARRDYLLKKKDLSETYEDKIFDIYNNKRLTHRQKMARIASLKKEANKKLDGYKDSQTESVAAEIREDSQRKFNKQYDIVEKPVKIQAKKRTLKQIAKSPADPEEKVAFWKAEERTAKAGIREGSEDLRKSLQTGKPLAGLIRGSKEANRKINFNRLKLAQATNQRLKAERELSKKKYRVSMTTPTIGEVKGEVIKSKRLTRLQAANLARKKKKLGWKPKIIKA